MSLKVKRVYDPFSSDDGKRVLVDRLWPRGIKKDEAHVDEWLKEIAPSDELRKWFSHDPEKWKKFRERYRAELAGADKKDIITRLRREAKKGMITLLFAAKDTEHNNALVLKEFLKA